MKPTGKTSRFEWRAFSDCSGRSTRVRIERGFTSFAMTDASAHLESQRTDGQPVGNASSPIPIFVVGMTRSGTKWLCNLLCAHESVTGVQNERHRGILETSLFDTTQRKFDLASDDDFAAFIELWSRSDFFRAAGADRSLFCKLDPSSRDYVRLFAKLMDDVARRRGCPYWLQKISPHSALPVLERFPSARVVTITRSPRDVIRSQAALNVRNAHAPGVAQTAVDYAFQTKYISRIRRLYPNAACVTYEALKENTDATVARLCDQLDLPPPTQPLRSMFPANSSFTHSTPPLSRTAELVGVSYTTVLRMLPLTMLSALSFARRTLRGAQPPASFHSGEFGLLKDSILTQRPSDKR